MGGQPSKEADGSITFANYVAFHGMGRSMMYMWLLPTIVLSVYAFTRLAGVPVPLSRRSAWITLVVVWVLDALRFVKNYLEDNQDSIDSIASHR